MRILFLFLFFSGCLRSAPIAEEVTVEPGSVDLPRTLKKSPSRSHDWVRSMNELSFRVIKDNALEQGFVNALSTYQQFLHPKPVLSGCDSLIGEDQKNYALTHKFIAPPSTDIRAHRQLDDMYRLIFEASGGAYNHRPKVEKRYEGVTWMSHFKSDKEAPFSATFSTFGRASEMMNFSKVRALHYQKEKEYHFMELEFDNRMVADVFLPVEEGRDAYQNMIDRLDREEFEKGIASAPKNESPTMVFFPNIEIRSSLFWDEGLSLAPKKLAPKKLAPKNLDKKKRVQRSEAVLLTNYVAYLPSNAKRRSIECGTFPIIHLNRPFLMILRDPKTKLILFMGNVIHAKNID